MLKVPYLSFALQACDAKGGAFSQIKPEYRKNQMTRLGQKNMARLNVQTHMRGAAPCLSHGDFVACVREPWMRAFNGGGMLRSWGTIGINPYNRKALWDFIKESKAATSATAKRLSFGADIPKASTQMATAISALVTGGAGGGSGDEPVRKKSKRVTAAAVYADYNGNATSEDYIAVLDEADELTGERVEKAMTDLRDSKYECAALKVEQLKDLLINKYGKTARDINKLKKRELCEMLAPLVVVPPLPPQNQPASGAPPARQQPERGARPTLQQLQGS
jgi:hypothetical protein